MQHAPTSNARSVTTGDSLNLPKNKSTGNLLAQNSLPQDTSRIRFSFDASSLRDQDALAMYVEKTSFLDPSDSTTH